MWAIWSEAPSRAFSAAVAGLQRTQPSPAMSDVMEIVVPPGVQPGQTFSFQLPSGEAMQLVLPDGVEPGERMQFRMPALAAAAAAPAAAPIKKKGGFFSFRPSSSKLSTPPTPPPDAVPPAAAPAEEPTGLAMPEANHDDEIMSKAPPSPRATTAKDLDRLEPRPAAAPADAGLLAAVLKCACFQPQQQAGPEV